MLYIAVLSEVPTVFYVPVERLVTSDLVVNGWIVYYSDSFCIFFWY